MAFSRAGEGRLAARKGDDGRHLVRFRRPVRGHGEPQRRRQCHAGDVRRGDRLRLDDAVIAANCRVRARHRTGFRHRKKRRYGCFQPDLGVGGGRQTVSLGAASTAACAEVRRKLLAVAGELLQTDASQLVLKKGRVVVVHGGGSIALTDVIARAEATQGPVSGSGAFTAPGVAAMPGCAAGHFIDAIDIPVFAVHDCEVDIEVATGRIVVRDYRVIQDVGRAINPRAIQSQVQGGVVQGLGYALHEEITINDEGFFDQSGFETYRIPLAEDVVPVDLEMFEGAPSIGPLGTKGAGEVPILNVGATIACAVANATGKPVSELPLTPPRVLSLLRDRAGVIEFDHVTWRSHAPGT